MTVSARRDIATSFGDRATALYRSFYARPTLDRA
jgi:hypothetical protein